VATGRDMLKTLIRKELLSNLLNTRFAVAYFLCTTLFVGSAMIMYVDLLSEKRTADMSHRVYERRMLEQTVPFEYVFDKLVARRVAPLQMFALGGERDPDHRAIIGYETSPVFFGDLRRDPVGNLFPAVDLVFTTGVIFSLLIFMLIYDAVSGERENGTLKLLLAGPVSRDRLIVAKWIGVFASIIVPFVTSSLLAVLVLLFSRDITLTGADWLAVAAILGTCVLYIAVMVTVSLAVSVLFRHSATAILALLFVWGVFVVALPSLSTPTAYLMVSPPSVQALTTAVRREPSQPERLRREHEAQEAQYRRLYGERDYEELTRQEQWECDNRRRSLHHEYVGYAVDGIVARVADMSGHDLTVDRLMRLIARLSPYGCLQNACAALARTDIHREIALREENGRFMQKTYQYFRTTMDRGDAWPFPAALGPRYRSREEPLGSAAMRALPDILVLVLMGAFCFLVAFAAFVRMDVT
jgi:ABC-type transport system involved in multi-copper enzyme maturation permease subunit